MYGSWGKIRTLSLILPNVSATGILRCGTAVQFVLSVLRG
jgi:hypothetical protein